MLPFAAVGMVLMTAVVGGAVDFSRVYRAKNQLQAACDAGVLAGRRAVGTDGYDSDAQEQASTFFNANFSSDKTASFMSSSDDDGNNVEGVATDTVSFIVMQLFGFDSFDITANCSASMGVGNADVMMVLDTTGSMSSTLSTSSSNSTGGKKSSGSTSSTTRIAALKEAMENFYDTLSSSLSGSNARVRYGFVPYSSTVNVGKLLYDLDPDYIADTHTYQSREPYYLTDSTKYSSTSYSSQSACSSALPSDTDTTAYKCVASTTTTTTNSTMNSSWGSSGGNSWGGGSSWGSSGGSSSTVYYIYQYTYTNEPTSSSTFDHWVYKPVEYDTSQFKTFASTTTYTGSDGAETSSTWDGCIEERGTEANTADEIEDGDTDDMLDIDIDTLPDSSDDDTKWAPLWPDVLYTRSGTSTTSGYSLDESETGSSSHITEYCPEAAQALEEMTESEFDAYAESLTANGGTYLDSGMIWGGRLLSPDGIFANLVNDEPENGGEVSRHIVFMTDGEMNTYNYVYSAWGLEYFDSRVTDDGSSNNDERHDARFLAVCSAIKAKGIRIWVVAFTTDLSDDLTQCASDDSSFTANSSDELNDAFQEIAKEVGELRIVS